MSYNLHNAIILLFLLFQLEVMYVDKHLTYPLYVSVNIQIVTPFVSSEKKKSTNITLSDT